MVSITIGVSSEIVVMVVFIYKGIEFVYDKELQNMDNF